MDKVKILIVFGTRPEAIKMSPLVIEFKKYSEFFDSRVCVTGQHREMLDQVLKIFDIVPEFDLNIMKSGQDLYDISSSVLLGMRKVFKEFHPDHILVHGDTATSTFAAISAYYEKISVGHVEAGLRTGNIYSPWPEEMNRSITGRIARYHFSPTETSRDNLIKENINSSNIITTGNTVIDSLFLALKKVDSDENLKENVKDIITSAGFNNLEEVEKGNRKLILVTGHRRENFGDGFINICEALKEISIKNKNFDIVYPVHLNPNVQKPVYKILNNLENVFLTKPLEYLPFLYLMKNSYLIITDSGGIQEEAPSLGKPVLVMRDTTERPEALSSGTVKLVGTDKNSIIKNTIQLIQNSELYKRMSTAINPYGDGKACSRIVEFYKQIYTPNGN